MPGQRLPRAAPRSRRSCSPTARCKYGPGPSPRGRVVGAVLRPQPYAVGSRVGHAVRTESPGGGGLVPGAPRRRWSDPGGLHGAAERHAIAMLEAALGGPVEVNATTEWDIQGAVLHAFRGRIIDEACLGLWNRDADQSARSVISRPQRAIVLVVLAIVVGGLIFATRTTLIVLSSIVGFGFLASVMFKFVVCLVGARLEHVDSVSDADVAALDPATAARLHRARTRLQGGQHRGRPRREPVRARLPAGQAADHPAARRGRPRDHRGCQGLPPAGDDHASRRAGRPAHRRNRRPATSACSSPAASTS